MYSLMNFNKPDFFQFLPVLPLTPGHLCSTFYH